MYATYGPMNSLGGRVGGRRVPTPNRQRIDHKVHVAIPRRSETGVTRRLGHMGRNSPQPLAAASQGIEASPGFESALEAFNALSDAKDRFKLLLEYAASLPEFPEEKMTGENRVMGCTAKVWVSADLDSDGNVQFSGTSDSELTKGLCAVLVQGLSGMKPDEVLEFDPETLGDFGLGPGVLTKSRTNGFLNMVETMKKRTRMLVKEYPRFPSLVIKGDTLAPLGDFAKAQAEFLEPNREAAKKLAKALEEKKVGVTAHFYMDPEVQGVLSAAKEFWPHIHVSDSLAMADASFEMIEGGCESIAVLGVDFMSENVRSILSRAGHDDIKVYRMSADHIGCSLAEAAESENYLKYLGEAAKEEGPHLHVIYINTSLKTKALANQLVPTITCTSSNVVPTILQAFAQVPNLNVWYGPDTYMGRNLVEMFESIAGMTDEQIKEIHPQHDRESIRSLLPRLKYFQDGACIVHDIFGGDVCELVQEAYGDAYLAAHFEVPGEMFTLAMEARKRGMGVVGSTSQILGFISDVVKDELEERRNEKLQFVLGTEAGMITSIVESVQSMLREKKNEDLEVEIVFPVSPDSITTGKQQVSGGSDPVTLPGDLAVIPGPASGEGCSLEGGCASCPFMKMNTLAALNRVLGYIGTPEGEVALQAFQPTVSEPVNGVSVAEAGCISIFHMRGFQREGKLTDDLVEDIMSRKEGE